MAATLPTAAADAAGDLEALRRLAKAEPFEFVTADGDLAQAARGGSRHLFSALVPLCPKSPFDRLLVDGFDAEQIWQQIDLQTRDLVPGLRRRLNQFKRSPDGIVKLLKSKNDGNLKVGNEGVEEFEEEVSGEEEGRVGGVEEVEEMEDEEEDEGEEEEGDGLRDVEDQFLKIKDQERYFEKREKEEFGEESGEDGEEDEEDEVDGADDEDNEDDDEFMDDIRYEDFFGSKEKGLGEKNNKLLKVKDMDIDENIDDGDDMVDDDDDDGDDLDDQKEEVLSTHEKQLKKIRSKIEQMEKANMEPKTWTMQGEVTAAKRPKNSALEVDLDFEHNMRPAPVITEEVTASLEDLIKKRILEAHFDDVQKPPHLPSNVRRELKQLDENKSKKGLGEIYEEEYTQKAGLASAPLSHTDEQKEANLLFKRLCLKLDALSHFHFAPKPVIEDMSIQSNLPALAMEEIAPLAVSDAAMLAPEEIFSGKGYIKEDGELTKADRKRQRAKKKRKFKAEALKRSAAKQSQAKES